jgi:hypothetical protein
MAALAAFGSLFAGNHRATAEEYTMKFRVSVSKMP